MSLFDRKVFAMEDVAEGSWNVLYPEYDRRSKMWKRLLGPFIDSLPDAQRELLEAVFYERKSHGDVAARLGLERSTVTRNLERAKAALVRAIAEQDPKFMAAEAAKPRRPGRPGRDPEAEEAAAWRVLQGRLKEALDA